MRGKKKPCSIYPRRISVSLQKQYQYATSYLPYSYEISVLLFFGPFNFRTPYPNSVLLIFVHPIINDLFYFIYFIFTQIKH